MTQPAKKAPAKKATRVPRAARTAAEKPAETPQPEGKPDDTVKYAEAAEDGKCPGCGAPVDGVHVAECPVWLTQRGSGDVMPTYERRYLSVHELWARVMDSVKSVEKGDYNKDQGFRFRGIDATVDAVGPALRRFGVHIRPKRVKLISSTEYTSKSGGRMVNRIVRVTWEVTGPQGDSFTGQSMGEASDSSDKSLAKAQSVAYRVYLLQALSVPTGEPDPDAETHERATPSERQQAVAQVADAPTYGSREEYERDKARQAQAGEENQDAQQSLENARQQMWRVAKGLGWEWKALVARFKADNDGREPMQTDADTIAEFTGVIVKEAEAEEDAAKQVAGEVLGAKEVGDNQEGDQRVL